MARTELATLICCIAEGREFQQPVSSDCRVYRCKAVRNPGVFQPPFYDSPEDYADALGSFLASGRLHGNPRTLAPAMAGLPELGWKRSFDICSAHPYTTGHALQVYRDYMRRKFPDRLKELDKVQTEEGLRMVLAQ